MGKMSLIAAPNSVSQIRIFIVINMCQFYWFYLAALLFDCLAAHFSGHFIDYHQCCYPGASPRIFEWGVESSAGWPTFPKIS